MDVSKFRILPALLVCSLALTGCSSTHAALGKPTMKNRWRIGPFAVTRTSVPASLFNDPYEAMVGSDTELRVGTAPPYVIYRTKLGGSHWTAITRLDCASQPLWSAIEGPAAALVCLGTSAATNRLVLISQGGSLATYRMPVHLPSPVPALEVGGWMFGGLNGDIRWIVSKNAEPPVLYGTGMIDLGSGRSGAIPQTLSLFGTAARQKEDMLSPNDALFEMRSTYPATQASTIFRWSAPHKSWVQIGRIPSFFGVMAVADDGSLWIRMPATNNPDDLTDWYIAHEDPGSQRAQKWRIHGNLLFVGPGYAVYTPYNDTFSLDILFPMQHRTLRFGGLVQPAAFAGTSFGVAEVGLPSEFGTATQVVLVGKGSNLQAIVISAK